MHFLTEGWPAEKWQKKSIPSAANIVNDPQGPIWTHGSPKRQSNLEVERLWFGVTSNMEVPGRSVRWMVTLIFPNINRFLPHSTFLTEGSDLSRGWSSLPYLRFHYEVYRGKKIKVLQGWQAQSPVMNIIEHIWGRMKENLEELWDAGKVAFHAIPDDFINKLYDSLPNRMATVLQAKGTHTRYELLNFLVHDKILD